MNSKRYRARVFEASRDKQAATTGELDDGVSSFSYLTDLIPSSILPEIFYGLGIKDIIRCKCVCKLWHKLISEPNFSTCYAQKSKLTPLLFYEHDTTSTFQEHLYLLEFAENGICSKTPVVPKLPGWLKQDRKVAEFFRIIGSCNGFLCWHRNRPECAKFESASVDTVYITNPIVGGYIALPERYCGYRCYSRHISGPSGNNIKVLRICFVYDYQGHIGSIKIEKCEIFTVGVDDNWRDVSAVSGLATYTKVVAFNSVFHWIPKGTFSNIISTFDLVGEKMGQISIPDELDLDNRPVELEVSNNQFCLVDYADFSHSQITIRKMQDYSVAESWTKTVILKSWFPTSMQPYRFRSIVELKVGDVLFADSACVLDCLVAYNTQQKKFSIMENFTSGKMMASRFHSYSPSFFGRPNDL